MNWSLKLGRLSRIPVYVHWTFAILLVYVWWLYASQGKTGYETFLGLALVILIFVCVTLHELGHALAARRYGIETSSITLLPIGGVAQLEKMPKKPSQELVVAVAGPLVNVVIAVLLVPVVWALFGTLDPTKIDYTQTTAKLLPLQLLYINLLLVIFNLIPAFPMDGGRMLRAFLASRFDYAIATRVAARIGQGVAIFFVLWGLLTGQFLLLFIALFVFLGAEAEARHAETTSAFENVHVKNAMLKRFKTLQEHDTLARAASQLLAGSQRDFPVVDIGDRMVGLLTRDDLIRGVTFGGYDAPLKHFMRREWLDIDPEAPLEDIYQEMLKSGIGTAPILEEGRVVGLLTSENIQEYVMLSSAYRTNRATHPGKAQPQAP
ncbi:MAG: site-2 protease family protein [Verrucomicrobiota bacterium]